MSQAASKMTTNALQPLVTMPCVIPSPWVWVQPSDMLLMNRIQQGWADVTSEIRLKKLWLLVFLDFSSSSQLLAQMKSAAMLWGAQWRGPRGMKLREASGQKPVKKWCRQPNNLWGTKSCQQGLEGTWQQMFRGGAMRWLHSQLTAWWHPCDRPWVWGPS